MVILQQNSVVEPEPVGTGTPLVGAGDGAGKKMRKKIMFYYFLVILYKKELESELKLVKKGTWSRSRLKKDWLHNTVYNLLRGIIHDHSQFFSL